MPIKGDNRRYFYYVKMEDSDEWQQVELQDAPNDLFTYLKESGEWERVKHGHWTINRRGNIECSLCGNEPYHDNKKNMNYCPNCGAKMDER